MTNRAFFMSQLKIPHICILSLAYVPLIGGAEVATNEIVNRLSKRANFTCITHRFAATWASEETMGGVRVVRVGRGSGSLYAQRLQKMLYPFFAWREMERRHREQPFDLVWLIMASYGTLAALLFKLRHPRVPLLLTLQEGDPESYILRRVGIFYPLWQLIFRYADHVQTISNYLATFAKRHGARGAITVVPNGVEIVKRETRNVKRNKKEKIIISTSRLVYKNGIDTLIRAMAILLRDARAGYYPKFPLVRLQLVGDGPDRVPLQKLAAQLGVTDLVEFVGAVPPGVVPQYLARAALFVRPSRSEGLGSSFLEAMGAGVPVIGTAVGGIPDFLKDPLLVGSEHATGIAVAVDNPRDLAQKIAWCLRERTLVATIAANGRRLIERDYQWDDIANRIWKIMDELVKREA